MSRQKVSQYEEKIKKAEKELLELHANYNKAIKGDSIEKARKEAKEDSFGIGYSRLRDLLRELYKASPTEGIAIGSKVIDLTFALKGDGQRMTWEEVLGYAKGFLKNYQVKYRNDKQSEAYNLVNSKTGLYYGQDELMKMKAQGEDLSLLNPIGDGKYWTDTEIESVKINSTYVKNSQLYKGSKIYFPEDGSSFEFDRVKRTDSRPKFNVTKVVNGKKLKFKLKFASETHSEVTAAALAAALGYNTDPSQHIVRPKVYFNKSSRQEFLRDLEGYYGYWNLEDSVAEEGEDSNGEYIIFKRAILEAKPKDHERLGRWPFNKNGHPDLREVRALSLFMAWINNNDLKVAEQNKVVLKTDGSADEIFYTNGDLGWSFGNMLNSEFVTFFKSNPIKSTRGGGISFNYITWHWSELFDDITYDDARWMVRRIARLSREQITDAVKLGGWPDQVGHVLTEKLIKRRNRIVKAFDLDSA